MEFHQSWYIYQCIYAKILWRSGLGLLMGKCRQFLTGICPVPSVLSFPDHNLSRYQWIFTKLDVVEI